MGKMREDVVGLSPSEIDTSIEFAAVAINAAADWKTLQRDKLNAAEEATKSGEEKTAYVSGIDLKGKIKWEEDLPPGVRNPYSISTERWDWLMLCLIMYSSFCSLLVLSWPVLKSSSPLLWIIDTIVDAAFIYDMYLSTCTAFKVPVVGGKSRQITDLKVIRAHYLKTKFWGSKTRLFMDGEAFHSFPYDLIAVAYHLAAGQSWDYAVAWAVYFGVPRFLRLIRLGRITRLIDAYDNTNYASRVRMLKVFAIFFQVAHVLACLFYTVGRRPELFLLIQDSFSTGAGIKSITLVTTRLRSIWPLYIGPALYC